jgi:hypothetical protein
MEETRNAAKCAALRALAAARRAEEEIGMVFHEQISFVSQKRGAAQPIRGRLEEYGEENVTSLRPARR